jgi:molybdate transport system substrate-binding protein
VRATLVAVAVLLGAACGTASGGVSISVFAAASLTDTFKSLGSSFERDHAGATVKFSFAGTPTLATQIEQGAHADVFAAADTANMDRLKAGGFVIGEPKVFVHNRLEIVVAPGNPKKISGLADLARPGLIYIAAGPTVPAGKYASQALAKAGVQVTPRSQETDVKAVVSKVELGEADAGIVYATDVRAAGDRVSGVPIPDQYNVVATYPIAAIKGAGGLANEFIDFALSDAGQSILESFGFQRA